MKGNFSALLPLLVLAAPLTGYAAEQLIPAGSLVQCTVSEPKLSSKTTDIGDPVLHPPIPGQIRSKSRRKGCCQEYSGIC